MVRLMSVILVIAAMGQATASDDLGVVGFWGSDTSIFEVSVEEGELQGHIRALKNPTYLPDEDKVRVGEYRTDDNNPDESLRARTLIGLSMFSDYGYEDGLWQGTIYDPESGNTYQSHMKLNRNGQLEIRGYVGMPMFGRTAKFVPISACTEAIVLMLPQIGQEIVCAVQQ